MANATAIYRILTQYKCTLQCTLRLELESELCSPLPLNHTIDDEADFSDIIISAIIIRGKKTPSILPRQKIKSSILKRVLACQHSNRHATQTTGGLSIKSSLPAPYFYGLICVLGALPSHFICVVTALTKLLSRCFFLQSLMRVCV